jgi:hypothetical protein
MVERITGKETERCQSAQINQLRAFVSFVLALVQEKRCFPLMHTEAGRKMAVIHHPFTFSFAPASTEQTQKSPHKRCFSNNRPEDAVLVAGPCTLSQSALSVPQFKP